MIIKYSAQNFTAKKVIELKEGDRILETEKKKKLRTVSLISQLMYSDLVPESDVGKMLIVFFDCSQLVKSPDSIVFVYNEPETKPDKVQQEILSADSSQLVSGAILERFKIPVLVVLITVPVVVILRWLFKKD